MAPTKGTAIQNLRVDPDLWRRFGELADPDRSAVLREYIRWYIREPGASTPKRPQR